MRKSRRRIVVIFCAFFMLVAGSLVLLYDYGFGFGFVLESYVIPDYTERSATLRQVLDYWENELAKQGLVVDVQFADQTGFDDPKHLHGLGGNGYLFLLSACEIFHANFSLKLNRVVAISSPHDVDDGVGSLIPES